MDKNKNLSKRIAKLARLVAEAPELSDIEAYFHDEVVSDSSFMAQSTQALHKPLRDIVGQVARSYGLALSGCRLYHVPRYSLWHGSLGSPVGSMALLVYFDDQHCGMASIARLCDVQTHRIRFSLPEGARDPDIELGRMEMITSVARRSGRGLA